MYESEWGELSDEVISQLFLDDFETDVFTDGHNFNNISPVSPTKPVTNNICDLKAYINSKKNPNTQRKADSAVKRLKNFLAGRNKNREIKDIEPRELDVHLGAFLLEMKKPDGGNYEPDTLTSFHRGIDRYLRDNDYGASIIEHDYFKMSREVLRSRRKELKEKGLGNKPQQADVLTNEDENKLWECGQLGINNPGALLRTVWFNNTKLLGFWGSQENRQLKWGDIQLKITKSGTQYLEFNERLTKTRDGKCTGDLRKFNPKIFANETNGERCPVRAYMKYNKNRPAAMCHQESPFYIAINQNFRMTPDALWYKSQPLGVNKLSTMMKSMAQTAGLTGKITNHSLRKTMCTRLLHAGVAPPVIAQLSGHRNVNSINNYAVASIEQQEEMCTILQPQSSSAKMLAQPRETIRQTEDLSYNKLPTSPNETCTISTTSTTSVSTMNKDFENKKRPAHEMVIHGMFANANITGGTFNINVQVVSSSQENNSVSVKKYRRLVITSDSESD